MTARIVYLATADARGHLMRAQLLVQALRLAGAQVRVLTTSDAGQRFLAGFGIEAQILSRHYAMQFDPCQNMLRGASNRNVMRYMADPGRMLRDILRLRKLLAGHDLLVNDSFHPAALIMGMLPFWRRKVVHVYGGSLREAVLGNFDGVRPAWFARLFRLVVGWQIDAARARFEHDFAYGVVDSSGGASAYQLPTPVPLAGLAPARTQAAAAVYLNPHFRDTGLADALCAGLADMGLAAHRVGEGYAGHRGWIGVDPDWASHAAHADVIISAPGMAALSVALVYARPIVLVLTEQPEQASNARRAALRIPHQIVTWRGDPADFRRQVRDATGALRAAPPALATVSSGRSQAQARVQVWTCRLLALCPPQA